MDGRRRAAVVDHWGAEQNPAYRPARPPYVCDLHIQLIGAASIRSASAVNPSTESIASRVRSSESGHRWLYVSSVSTALAWPSRDYIKPVNGPNWGSAFEGIAIPECVPGELPPVEPGAEQGADA